MKLRSKGNSSYGDDRPSPLRNFMRSRNSDRVRVSTNPAGITEPTG